MNELNWKIIKSVLKSEKPISNKELTLGCNVAINTIRKEISLIKEEVEKHRFSIVSKTSIGNYIEIAERETAVPYIERLYDLYKRNQRMSNQHPPHIYYLVCRCLCSTGNMHFTKEQIYRFAIRLCEEMKLRHNKTVSEQDVLALAMLLLSYESQNQYIME